MIGATSRPARVYSGKNHRRPCTRCGVLLQFKGRNRLCKDCKEALSVEERALWAA